MLTVAQYNGRMNIHRTAILFADSLATISDELRNFLLLLAQDTLHHGASGQSLSVCVSPPFYLRVEANPASETFCLVYVIVSSPVYGPTPNQRLLLCSAPNTILTLQLSSALPFVQPRCKSAVFEVGSSYWRSDTSTLRMRISFNSRESCRLDDSRKYERS